MTPAETPPLTALADGADRLYTLPAVALEVLRLTEQPGIDARALCRCLESDPALAAKLLRVVNSSLYGLPCQIASLSQAIALLGVQPLRLLVLGFSLPDKLLAGVPGEALRRYWTEALTTATAARQIASGGWGRLGDEAFLAGLMQGLGRLVLIDQLGEEYAQLIEKQGAAAPFVPRPDLLEVERRALGFDHRELSVELLRRWGLPDRLATAIEHQRDESHDHLEGDEACLAQSLRLANQLNRLVSGRDLLVLQMLKSEGSLCGDLTKEQLNQIVDSLQGRVAQLAQAMSIDIEQGFDQHELLTEAHHRLSQMTEEQAGLVLAAPRSADDMDEDERLGRELLLETSRLSAAMRVFLAGGTGPRTDDGSGGEEADATASSRRPHAPPQTSNRDLLVRRVQEQADRCREERLPMAVALFEVSDERTGPEEAFALREWLKGSAVAGDFAETLWSPLSSDRCAVLLPGIDRHDANRLWSEVADALAQETRKQLNVGVAGVAQLPRGFDAERLVEPAERCLAAALEIAGSAIKSLEVF
ncbi:HDOD domain protein [Planctomycetes bacterium MalM25]|nr:HDOD domain protein [Planctomycetes bacterium MalM25]